MAWIRLVVISILALQLLGKVSAVDRLQEGKDRVSRPNYGVQFQPIKVILPASSTWTHVFKMKIPIAARLNVEIADRLCSRMSNKTKIQPDYKWETKQTCYADRCRVYNYMGTVLTSIDNCDGQQANCNRSFTNTKFERPQTASSYKCIVMRRIHAGYEELREKLRAKIDKLRQESLVLLHYNSSDGRSKRNTREENLDIEVLQTLEGNLKVLEERWLRTTETSGNLTRTIREHIQEVPRENDRSKRNAIGNFIGSLFGWASQEDVERMAKIVDHMQSQNIEIYEGFIALKEDTTSYMKVANDRMDGLSSMIGSVYDRLKTTTDALENRTTSNAQLLIYSMATMNRMLDRLFTIEQEMSRFASGINDLIQGKLSPFIITNEVMKQTILGLQDRLRRNYRVFHLTEVTPQYYYRHAKVHHFRSRDDTIFITMAFPLSSIKKSFFLYSANIYNIPLKQGSEFSSRLQSQVDYFGVTSDARNFIELTQKELSQCEDTTAVRCTSSIQIFDAENPTCMAAIFQDKVEDITALCEFRFEKSAPRVEMMDEGNGKLLISNADYVIIQCQTETPRRRSGCTFCQIDFLCGCSVYVANAISNAAMPARINNCVPPLTTYSIQYPINLAVLAQLYSAEDMNEMKGDEMFETEQIPRLPEIMIDKSFEIQMNRDYEYSMDLKKVLRQAQRNEAVAPIRMIALSSWTINSFGDFFTLPNVLSLVALGSAVVCVFLVWMIKKSQKVMERAIRAGLGAKMMTAVHPAELPGRTVKTPDLDRLSKILSMMETDEVKEEGKETVFDDQETCMASYLWEQHFAVMMLSILGLSIMVIYLMWRLYQRRPFTRVKLFLELGTPIQAVSLLLLKLPGTPSNLHVMTGGVPRHFRITGTKCHPTLTVNWMGLIVVDRTTNALKNPVNPCPIPPLLLPKVRRILRAPYTVAFKFRVGKEIMFVRKFCNLNCDGTRCNDLYREATVRRRVYPKLGTMLIPNAPEDEPDSVNVDSGEHGTGDARPAPAYLGSFQSTGSAVP